MRQVVLIGLVGLLAQMIDGSLGMAYGVTTASLLLAVGLAPAITSTVTHLAEVGTTLAAGIAHHRFGNVDWRMVGWLGVPGAVGAILGARVLTSIDATVARPWMSIFLLSLGIYIMLRYALVRHRPLLANRRIRRRYLAPLGIVAGFLDAAGGGGWGPLGTSSLLASRRVEPRKVVGTIDTAEFLVALSASGGFVYFVGTEGVPWPYVAALLAGGVVAAPLAAWLVTRIHPRLLGTAAGGVILITNLRTGLQLVGVRGTAALVSLLSAVLAWLMLLVMAVLHLRRDREEERRAGAS